jgi:hypothetical protein
LIFFCQLENGDDVLDSHKTLVDEITINLNMNSMWKQAIDIIIFSYNCTQGSRVYYDKFPWILFESKALKRVPWDSEDALSFP